MAGQRRRGHDGDTLHVFPSAYPETIPVVGRVVLRIVFTYCVYVLFLRVVLSRRDASRVFLRVALKAITRKKRESCSALRENTSREDRARNIDATTLRENAAQKHVAKNTT